MAMAYADGELDAAGRREFEALLEQRPDLAREVADHQRLLVLGRRMAGAEPQDHEWQRLRRDPLQRAGMGGGLLLLAVGLLGLAGEVAWSALTGGDGTLALAVSLGCLLVGCLGLLLATLRARLRTRPYDPYRDIVR